MNTSEVTQGATIVYPTYTNGGIHTRADNTCKAALVGTTAAAGSDFSVQLKYEGFGNTVGSITQKIKFDASKVSYTGLTSSGTLTGAIGSANNGILTIVWTNSSGANISWNANGINLHFQYIGNTSTTIEFYSGSLITDKTSANIAVSYSNCIISPEITTATATIGSIAGIHQGDDFNVPITFSNFPYNEADGVRAMTLTLPYDNSNLDYIGVLAGSNIYGATVQKVGASINISWTDGATSNINGDFLRLRFKYVGIGAATISFGAACSFVSLAGNQVQVAYTNSSITPATSAYIASIGSVYAVQGSQVLVPISFANLPTNMGAVTLMLTYDASKLSYVDVQNNSSNATVGVKAPNNIKISWANATASDINGVFLKLRFLRTASNCDAAAAINFVPRCELVNISTAIIHAVWINGDVHGNPDAPNAITGIADVCVGLTTTFASTTAGGVWTSATPANASIHPSTGVITGVADGTSLITYTVTNSIGCTNTATKTVAVHANPTAPDAITGTAEVCVGSTTTFASTTAGGVWTSATPANATINASSGIITGVAAGTSLITYTVTNSYGCTNITTQLVTVNALPMPTTTGSTSACTGETASIYNVDDVVGHTYSWSVVGGSFSPTTAHTITVTWGSAGAGTVDVTETISATGCYKAAAQKAIVIYPTSVGGSISGTSTITYGSSTGTLTLGGYVGTIQRWEKRLNNAVSWTQIANFNATYSESPNAAGTWQYRAFVKSGVCAETSSDVFTQTVNKAPLTVTANDKTKVYGATDPTLDYTAAGTLYFGDTYSVITGMSLSTTTTAAATFGTHTIYVSGGTADNYSITHVSGTLTVSKAAALTVTANDKSKVYGEADPTLDYSVIGTLYYSDASSVITGVGLSTTTGYAATYGTHVITVSGAVADNYNLTLVNGTLTVGKATLSIIGASTHNKPYDGTNTASVTDGTLVGVLAGDVANVVLHQTGTFGQTNIGTGISITATCSISGSASYNYSLSQPSLTSRDITAVTLTVSGATTHDKVYDGTNTASVTDGTLLGVVSGEEANVILNQTGTFAQNYIGISIPITATCSISGSASGNYLLTQPSLTAKDITVIALSITGAITHDKQYDGNNTASITDGVLIGVLISEVANVTFHQTGIFAQTGIGTSIAINPLCTISGSAVGNYTLTQPSLIARNITPVQLTPHITANDKCFDGNTATTLSAQWVTGMVNEETDVTVTVGAKSFDLTSAGSRTVTASNLTLGGTKASNYVLASGATATDIALIYALPIADDISGANAVVMGNTLALSSNASPGNGNTYAWISTQTNVATVDASGVSIVLHPVSIGTTNVRYTVTDGTTQCINTANTFVVNVTGRISGNVSYDNAYATLLNNITITLKDNSGNTVATTTTGLDLTGINGNGYYEFNNNLSAGTYTVSGSYTNSFGGNNATDALVVQRRAIGVMTLSPLRTMAADVNVSGGITALDALYIKLRTVGTITSYPAGNWKFETPSVTLTGSSVVPIKGLCFGDVNGSYIPQFSKDVETYQPVIADNTVQIQKGIPFLYEVRSEAIANLGAMTLVMNYDNSIYEIQELSSTFENLNYEIQNGKIIVAWSDFNGKTISDKQALFTLLIKAKETPTAETQIFSVVNVTEFADVNADVLDNVRLKLANVITRTATEISVMSFPNPFREISTISYTLPENSSVKITLKNVLGQSIATIFDGTKEAGFFTVEINADDFNLTSGLYFYTFEVKSNTSVFNKTNKLVVEKK